MPQAISNSSLKVPYRHSVSSEPMFIECNQCLLSVTPSEILRDSKSFFYFIVCLVVFPKRISKNKTVLTNTNSEIDSSWHNAGKDFFHGHTHNQVLTPPSEAAMVFCSNPLSPKKVTASCKQSFWSRNWNHAAQMSGENGSVVKFVWINQDSLMACRRKPRHCRSAAG